MRTGLKAALALAAIVVVQGCALFGGRTFRLELTGAGQSLTRITTDDAAEFRPAVSPDGTTLLFDTERGDDRTIVSVDPSSGARRTIYTSASSQSQEVAWSPEGDWFAYTTNAPGNWSLVRSVTRSPNAAVAVLVSGDAAPLVSDPSVSPDGKRVAFATFIRGQWQIAVSDVTGSNLTFLGEGIDPAWSPVGDRLAFARRVSDWWQIYSINANTGVELVQITTGETDNLDPTWSPDGDFVLFTSNRSARRARRSGEEVRLQTLRGPFNLYAIQPDGTGLVQLTDGDGLNVHPMWGKDGWIYFSSNQAGDFDIWRLRPGLLR